MARLKSPSVKIPCNCSCWSMTNKHPHFFDDSSCNTSMSKSPGKQTGISCFLSIKSATCMVILRPSNPAGWLRAKSLRPYFFEFINAMAKQSPKIIWIAAEDVGARSKGQISLCTGRKTDRSLSSESLESFCETIAIVFAPFFRIKGIRSMSSFDCPLLLKHRIKSSGFTKPMSPCKAFEGLRKKARVPVDINVAAIFSATWPLLPTPEQIITPLHSINACKTIWAWLSLIWSKKWFRMSLCWESNCLIITFNITNMYSNEQWQRYPSRSPRGMALAPKSCRPPCTYCKPRAPHWRR